MVRQTAYAILLLLLFQGCTPQKIYLSPAIGYNDQIRLDGFWYTSVNPNTNAIQIIFLYENGVALNMFSFESLDIPYFRAHLANYYSNIEKHKDSGLGWGALKFENEKITITQWYPSSGGPLPVYVKEGEILNDSTFVIKSFKTTKGKMIKPLNYVYNFYPFSPKPDSTNNFIKTPSER